MGIFFCQGEICSAGSRLFVEESIYEDFVGRLADMYGSIATAPLTTLRPGVDSNKVVGDGRKAHTDSISSPRLNR